MSRKLLKRGNLFLSAILLCLLVSGSTCFNNGDPPPPQNPLNQVFRDSYFASVRLSTPNSATASFPATNLVVVGKTTVLATLNNWRVTLITTTDTSGQPVWLCTVEGDINANKYKVLPTDGFDGLKFEIMLKNAAGGLIGDWITDPFPVRCSSQSTHVLAQHNFLDNVLHATTQIAIDVSQNQWKQCP